MKTTHLQARTAVLAALGLALAALEAPAQFRISNRSILRAERCRRARQSSYASPPTDSSVRAHELREECAALVDSLSPDERALVLRRAWGWTLAEISEESGAQIATVRRRLAGVQSRLREGSR